MKIAKKLTALAVSSLMMFSVAGITASAATVTQDGLNVSLTTDKTEYKKDEAITATLTVENTGGASVKDVKLENIVPEGYEVCAKDVYGSLAFPIVSETECLVQIDDCILFTPVGPAEVTLPLPDGFVYYDHSGGEEGSPLTAEEFIRQVTEYGGFNPYNTSVVMENGQPVRIDHSDYPEGPEE